MATTAQNIYDKSISIIDDLSDTGTVDATQSAEYAYRAPSLLDLWQKEIVRSGNYFKTYDIDCFPKTNLLGEQFSIVENEGTAQEYSGDGAYSFFIDLNGDATLTFTEDGSSVNGFYSLDGGTATAFTGTVTATKPGTSFYSVRGIFTSSGGTIKMSVNGTYYFRHKNRALMTYKYSAATSVPDYRPWVKVDMPADFKSVSQIVSEYPTVNYAGVLFHKWEGNDLYVNYNYKGLIRITYVPVPTTISALTATMEVDDVTCVMASWYLAEQFALSDQNTELASMCHSKYQELKGESQIKSPQTHVRIIDVY